MVSKRWCSLAISARMATRNFASKFDKGSSIKKTLASRTIARPSATRWRCPPESAAGLRCKYSVKPRISAAFSTRFLISALSYFLSFKPKAMLSKTVICG